jgi:hypothetical protein
MTALYARPGQASTLKVADWPTFTRPTSASSTSTCSSIFARSSASVNSTGAWKEAATVCPGSMSRSSTTPSMGERMLALPTSVWFDCNSARTCTTLARALASLASARFRLASAVSISVRDGTLPPDSCATCRNRSSVARASATVACACSTCASAAARFARDRVTASCSLARSRRASSWPRVTSSLSSTNTCSTMPDSSLPTSTWLVGCRLPVAETLTTSVPTVTSSVL